MKNSKKQAGNAAAIVVLVLALAVAGFLYWRYNDKEKAYSTVSPSSSVSVSASPTPSSETSVSKTPTSTVATVKSFTVAGGEFFFNPSEIKVNKGDTVKITFANQGAGTHDWVIDAFNVRTPLIGGGETATVQFVADKAGTFEYYCSVGAHRALGMRGNLIVQ